MNKKLSQDKILQLCEMYKSGTYSQRKLATYFNTSTYTINKIIKEYDAKPNKIDHIKTEFQEAGYELISKEYINRDELLEYICPKHGIQKISYKSFKNGSRCKECYNEKRAIPFEEISEHFKERGFTLLTKKKDYRNSKSQLVFLCKEHGVKTTSWDSFRHAKYGCHECYLDSIKVDFMDIQNQFKKAGYTLSSTADEYINSKESLKYICPTHGMQYISWSNFKQGKRCPQCDIDDRKIQWDNIDKALKSAGYKLISKEYINSYSELQYSCPEHGLQITTWKSFKSGTRCPMCAIENHKGYYSISRSKKYKDEWQKIDATVYWIKIFMNDEVFYKIGVTTHSIRQRMNTIPCDDYEVLDEIKTNLFKAVNIEYKILSELQTYKYKPSIKFKGSTECIDLKAENIHKVFNKFK